MWELKLSSATRPTVISLGRYPVGDVPNTDRKRALHGACVSQDSDDADVTLTSCGTCLHRVVAAGVRYEETLTVILSAHDFLGSFNMAWFHLEFLEIISTERLTSVR